MGTLAHTQHGEYLFDIFYSIFLIIGNWIGQHSRHTVYVYSIQYIDGNAKVSVINVRHRSTLGADKVDLIYPTFSKKQIMWEHKQ